MTIKLLLLTIIALLVLTADISFGTANFQLMDKSYIYISLNGHYNVFTVPFHLPLYYWSW